jgi:LuxR family maltose regulon positive regulatory protein
MHSWLALMRAMLGRDGVDVMRRDAREAVEGLAAGSVWRPTAFALAGLASYCADDIAAADVSLARAVDSALHVGAFPAGTAALALRATIAADQGDWSQAQQLVEQAERIVRDGNLEGYASSCVVFATAARVAAQHGDVARAQALLTQAARLRPLQSYAIPTLSVVSLLVLARGYLVVDDAPGARAVLRQIGEIVQQRPNLGALTKHVQELQELLESQTVRAVGASSLTTAELRLLPMLATHLTFPEIGQRLYVSRHTVKSQVASIYQKLGVSSRSDAIDRARAIGLLS